MATEAMVRVAVNFMSDGLSLWNIVRIMISLQLDEAGSGSDDSISGVALRHWLSQVELY